MRRKRIGFYLENGLLACTDFTDVLRGNPGVGGTEYATIFIAYLLSNRDNNIDITLYLQKEISLPSKINCVVVEDMIEASDKAEEDGIEYLLVDAKLFDKSLLDRTKHFSMRYILWCHTFVGSQQSKMYAKSDRIAKLLSVGREESELFIDDIDVKAKSDYIYNPVPFDVIKKYRANEYLEWSERGNNVVFVGNLGANKCFLTLAKAWKKVVSRVPDANLYVIGSVNLYGFSSEADLSAYNKALDYLSVNDPQNPNRKILMDSVHMCGVMGDEKFDIIKKCKVGVPNPGGAHETFGYVVVEMQSMGCLIATKCCCGYLDTAFENAALYYSPMSLTKCIVKQLKRSDNRDSEMLSQMEEYFEFDSVILEWESFFKNINAKIPHKYKKRLRKNFRLKRLKCLMFNLKQTFPILRTLPSLDGFAYHFDRLIDNYTRKFYQ